MKTVPGVNIQWPWSQLIATGKKKIETRGYPLPPKFKNIPLALIETPGRAGLKSAGIRSARIIALVTFDSDFRYTSRAQWEGDFNSHLVPKDHLQFQFSAEKPRWGWRVSKVETIEPPSPAPKRKGIRFTLNCKL